MPELPEAVQQILHEALRRSPKERPAYLDSACGSDAGLRARIEAALARRALVTAPTLTASAAADPATPAGPGPGGPGPGGTGTVPDFNLIKLIGRGGFGTVWVARNEHTREHKAVKIVPATGERAHHAEIEVRGIVEYKRRVEGHPGFIPIDHVGRIRDAYYIVMPLADCATGTAEIRDPHDYEPLSLRLFLERKGHVSAREALDIVGVLLRSLGHLHEQGATHYDVKPDNVMRWRGTWCLGDHGLMGAQHTAPGGSTPPYAPPEGPGDRISDLYALGKILFELMTGENVRRFDELAGELSSLRPEDPTWVAAAAIVNRACHTDPDRRYRTADDFLEATRRTSSATAIGPEDPVLRTVLAKPVGESDTERAVKQIAPWVISVGVHAGLVALGFIVTWTVGRLADDREALLVTAQFDALTYDLQDTIEPEPIEMTVQPETGRLRAPAFEQMLAERRAELDPMPGSLDLERDAVPTWSDFSVAPEQDTVTFLGLTTLAKKIVYVIDASGSMIPTFHIIIDALARSLGELSSEQSYAVVFFQDSTAVAVPPRRLTDASLDAKVATLQWIAEEVVPQGGSDPRVAIEKALSLGPQVIFLLSENITGFGQFELDKTALLAFIQRKNPVGKPHHTRINCIQFLDTDPIDTLQEIARIHGGPDGFRLLKRAELGLD